MSARLVRPNTDRGPQRALRRSRVLLTASTTLFAVVLLAAPGCTSVPVDDQLILSTQSEPPPPDPAVVEFCSRLVENQREQREGYVGSDQHVADVERVLDVALPGIRAEFVVFRDFIASGAVDPVADPESVLFENWPEGVQVAVERIQEFGRETC